MRPRTFALQAPTGEPVVLEASLAKLVGEVEGRIRRDLPLASAFAWEGSVLEGAWRVTAQDASRAPLAEYALTTR